MPKLYELLSGNSIYVYKFCKIGNDSFFHKVHKIINPQFISIGNRVTIEKDAWLNVVTSDGSHGFIEIHDDVNLGMRTTLSSANKIIISKSVLIGLNVYIADHQHNYTNINASVKYQGISGTGSVIINEGSWIGNNVVLLASKDLTIGKQSVVGANSVVKESIPDYCVAVGNPAKVVKRYDRKLKRWVKAAL